MQDWLTPTLIDSVQNAVNRGYDTAIFRTDAGYVAIEDTPNVNKESSDFVCVLYTKTWNVENMTSEKHPLTEIIEQRIEYNHDSRETKNCWSCGKQLRPRSILGNWKMCLFCGERQ